MPKINNLLHNKLTLGLIIIIIVLIVGGVFAYQKFISSKDDSQILEEVDLPFDPEGPYALLYPRKDGNALVLNLKRTGSYDKISYDLAYVSEAEKSSESGEVPSGGIDRGVSGDINTKDKKGEYEQEILFGTCSKNVCKYDKGVENGTLTLHIQKGNHAYRMITQWHIQKPDIALGKLTSGDTHFIYQIDPNSTQLSLVDYSIINDLSGAPKLAGDKQILGKVYGVNAPVAKTMPFGQITIELAENPPVDAKIARFDESLNKWIEMDTKISGSTLTAKSDTAGIITVLSATK
ncbi:MAG: hypothetical protein WCV81_02150 [Microgenomates group bacterium]|jgi:hypothetical protein